MKRRRSTCLLCAAALLALLPAAGCLRGRGADIIGFAILVGLDHAWHAAEQRQLRDEMLYDLHFCGPGGGTPTLMAFKTGPEREAQVEVRLTGGRARPGRRVEPIALEVRPSYRRGGRKPLAAALAGLSFELSDSRGKKYAVGPGRLARGGRLVYEIKDWGQMRVNDPDYRLTLVARLKRGEETLAGKAGYTPRRGAGPEWPLAARADAPARGR